MYKLNVLVVEDDEEVASNLQFYLSHTFQKVDVAHNAKEAFEKYMNGNYELVMSEVALPLESGVELFQKVRKLDGDVLLILFGNYAKEKYLADITTLKLDGYITKPMTSKKLDEIFLHVLQKDVEEKIISRQQDICYSYRSKMLTCKGESISLSHFEIILIELFLSNKHYKITHEMIASALYDGEGDLKGRIKNLIKRLRQKVPCLKILPLINVGYQLACSEER